MNSDFAQFKDIFIETAKENVQLLNNSLLKIEKNMADKAAIEDAFRASHSLKSEGASMDYNRMAFLAHTVEDVLHDVKTDRLKLTPEIADSMFGALDNLSRSIATIESSDQDLDVTAQVEQLKKLTGVKTEGTGKSIHAGEPAAAPATVATTTPPAPAPTSPTPPETTAPTTERIRTVSVKVEQLDSLMNLFEELLVHRLTLGRLVQTIDSQELADYHHQVEKIIEALQFEIMKIRAVPLKIVFDHYPRAVRDLARTTQKDIGLHMQGDDLELDRTIAERLDEPLTHIIRNAVSHGISKKGTITISARREQDSAVIDVSDDGEGINWQAVAKKAGVSDTEPSALKAWLFSGLSTAEKITEISGRGVGLRAVKQSIEELGGSIDVISQPGQVGTTFTIKLPLSLAVMKAVLVRVGTQQYAIPTNVIDRSVKVAATQLATTAGQEAFVLDDTEVPLLRLHAKFTPEAQPPSAADDVLAVVVMLGKERLGLVVDEVIQAADMIVKPVPDILKGNRAFGGTTILGDGRSALILNVGGLL